MRRTVRGVVEPARRGLGTRRGQAWLPTVVLLAVVTAGCASGSESSFTSITEADAQARAWVDAAVTSAVPGASTADGHSEGPDTCTTSPDFSEYSYSLSVDVPADQVDATTLAIWQGFQDQGFGNSPSGTTPVAPGPGSPSWTISLFRDGFRVEITGARTEPTYVSTYIITPCLRTT